MKRKALLAVIPALLCLLTGCAARGAAGDAASQDSESGQSHDFIFVVPILENEYWQSCIEGVQKADAELGTHTEVIGPQTADNYTEEIVGYMEQAVAARPDGIITYAGIEALYPLIDEATGQGIPVIAVDSDAPSTSRAAYVGTDTYNAGYRAGETLVELTGGTGKVGVLVSSLSADKEMQVLEAFKDAVQDYGMEIVAIEETDANPDLAEEKAREMLAEHPEITAMFNTAGYDVTGAARVKEEQGLDDLVLLGFDDVEENLAFVREGVIDALFVQATERMGYQSVYLMEECADGNSLAKTSYDTGMILVTQENVDTYSSTELAAKGSGKTVRVGYYTGDADFQDGFADDERKSGYAYEYYQTIASLTGWTYEYVYASREDVINMLLAGEVDIVAGAYQTGSTADQALFSKYDMGLSGDARYFAVSVGREDLLTELNYAMEQINLYAPNYTVTLYQKYYGEDASQQMLTDSEKQWLEEKGTLNIGYVRYNLPLSDRGDDGEPAGVISDLLDILAEYLHVTINPVCYENIVEMDAGLRAGEIDAAFPFYSDLWVAESLGFYQTDTFISDRVMILYQGGYSSEKMKNVGLSDTGVGQRYYMDYYYPESHLTIYDTRKDMFEALLDGEVSCIVGCSSILQHFLALNTEYSDLTVAYLDTSEEFGMAVNQGESVLVSVLNKAIRQIDDATITNAMVSYSSVEVDYTFMDFVQRYAILVSAILFVFFAILLLVFISYRRKSRLFNVEQAKSQAALEQALEAANQANRAKTTFLSSMSHDIRTPMNAIIGMTSIAAKHLDDPDRTTDCLNKIKMSSNHLLTLINDILDISKIESGKLTLNPVNFSLRDMVTSLVNIVRPQIKDKNQEFDAHVSYIEHEIVCADEVRVNQVFINILTNAVKYTPEGGRIVMSLSGEEIDGGEKLRLVYTVEDNGIGMSEEFMANMYETFSRAKDSRVNGIQGTGLGLAIVKQMVDLMGGTIECRSAEGKGTKFTVTLDLQVGEAKGDKPALPGTRVLLVDDDEIFLEAAGEMLRSMGAQPETASSGSAAVELVKARHREGRDYPVAIVDWKMPGMNGMETIAAIREETGSGVPVILVSAYDWSDIEDEVDMSCVNGFINKPFFRSYLYEKLRDALDLGDGAKDEEEELDNDLGGKHLLIAEDNDLNWEVIEELLGMYGITSERAENGRVCIDMLTGAPKGHFDLILMDVQMPVMNGREAAAAIRKLDDQACAAIPIIAMTADAFAEDIAACMEAGMDGHVSKPVDLDKLCREMHKVLSRQHARGSEPSCEPAQA